MVRAGMSPGDPEQEGVLEEAVLFYSNVENAHDYA